MLSVSTAESCHRTPRHRPNACNAWHASTPSLRLALVDGALGRARLPVVVRRVALARLDVAHLLDKLVGRHVVLEERRVLRLDRVLVARLDRREEALLRDLDRLLLVERLARVARRAEDVERVLLRL